MHLVSKQTILTLEVLNTTIDEITNIVGPDVRLMMSHAESLHEHLRIHEIFIVDQNKSCFLHNYRKFSIKSYVVAIY